MGIEVLKSQLEVGLARCEMSRRGIDCLDGWLVGRLKRWGVLNGVEFRDIKKSWDVLKTVEFIEGCVPKDGAILDLGAYASEVLPVLFRLDYRNLTGVDLNPKLVRMPETDKVRYLVSDFLATPFADASFDAISAISVIEHGFQCDRLFREISRLLKPGGYFVASVDYWQQKIDTDGIRAFGMDWRIFSEQELLEFLERAACFGLQPCGPLDFSTSERTVKWCGKEYTFAWLALKKGSR